MSETTKRYLISSLVTFLGGFLTVILAQIDAITIESFYNGALVGILFTAVRTGVKSLIEYFLLSK
jgi:hypothetical protein